jgi:hypothetical protein
MAFLDDTRHSDTNKHSSYDTLAVIAFLFGFWALVLLIAGNV